MKLDELRDTLRRAPEEKPMPSERAPTICIDCGSFFRHKGALCYECVKSMHSLDCEGCGTSFSTRNASNRFCMFCRLQQGAL